MARLRNRTMFIPGGFKFTQPEISYQSRPWASFEAIVNSLMVARRANPALAQKHGWALDHDGVARDVEAFNAAICEKMGWTDYIVTPQESPPPPKSRPLSPEDKKQAAAAAGAVKKIWAGVRTLNDWLDSGEPPINLERAEQRAEICIKCPKNGQGDFTKWFTSPASEVIKRQLAKLHERSITTQHDAKLNICEVCLCPLKLKVHTPMKFIKAHLSDQLLDDLRKVPDCWIPSEL